MSSFKSISLVKLDQVISFKYTFGSIFIFFTLQNLFPLLPLQSKCSCVAGKLLAWLEGQNNEREPGGWT